MPTPYSDIFDAFLNKVSDYDFLKQTQEELEVDFEKYLKSATIRFKNAKVNLNNRNETAKEFSEDLTYEEVEIIATLMVVEYLTPKIISTENLRQMLSDREYGIYSQARQLQEMMALKRQMRLEATQLMSDYTYSDGLGGLD